jgi:hypothetical protein
VSTTSDTQTQMTHSLTQSMGATDAAKAETVSVQGVLVDKWAFTQAFNGGKGKGMERERHRIQVLLDNLIQEANTTKYQDYETYVNAFEYVKYKIDEKYLKRRR